MIEGKLINLRLVMREDLVLLDKWVNDPATVSEFNFFGYRSFEKLVSNFEKNGPVSEDSGRFMVILKNGSPIGDVSYHVEAYGPNAGSRAYNIGISLIPEGRGKGYGVEAQRLLADYLFRHMAIERVEASTDIENIPEQRALEKAGFTREGVFRHAQFRNGAWHDLVVYSRLRGDE